MDNVNLGLDVEFLLLICARDHTVSTNLCNPHFYCHILFHCMFIQQFTLSIPLMDIEGISLFCFIINSIMKICEKDEF